MIECKIDLRTRNTITARKVITKCKDVGLAWLYGAPKTMTGVPNFLYIKNHGIAYGVYPKRFKGAPYKELTAEEFLEICDIENDIMNGTGTKEPNGFFTENDINQSYSTRINELLEYEMMREVIAPIAPMLWSMEVPEPDKLPEYIEKALIRHTKGVTNHQIITAYDSMFCRKFTASRVVIPTRMITTCEYGQIEFRVPESHIIKKTVDTDHLMDKLKKSIGDGFMVPPELLTTPDALSQKAALKVALNSVYGVVKGVFHVPLNDSRPLSKREQAYADKQAVRTTTSSEPEVFPMAALNPREIPSR